MNLRKYQEKTSGELKPLAVDLGDGDVLNIVYRRSDFTVKEIRQFREMMNASQKADADASAGIGAMDMIVTRFLKSVVRWDATADGEPVPLTRAGLEDAEVDLTLIQHILTAIGEDGKPNPTTGSK